MQRPSTVYKGKQQYKTVLRGHQRVGFFTGGSLFMDYGLIFCCNGLKLKGLNGGFVILLFTSQDLTLRTGVITCELLRYFYQLFGLSLMVPIHCRGYIGEQVIFESDFVSSSCTSGKKTPEQNVVVSHAPLRENNHPAARARDWAVC